MGLLHLIDVRALYFRSEIVQETSWNFFDRQLSAVIMDVQWLPLEHSIMFETKYLEIADELESRIASRAWRHRLPGVATLSKECTS